MIDRLKQNPDVEKIDFIYRANAHRNNRRVKSELWCEKSDLFFVYIIFDFGQFSWFNSKTNSHILQFSFVDLQQPTENPQPSLQYLPQ